jgi:hypothetical protein
MMESEPSRVESVDLDNANKIFRLVEKNLRGPAPADPVEWAFLQASYPEFFGGGRLRPHLEEAFAMRRARGSYFPPGYALRTLEFSIDKQARLFIPEYPYGFDKTEAWEAVYSKLDPFELVWDMQINLQSSMADAYGIYHLLTQAFQARWGDNPTVIDTGASMALGLKKWLLPGEGFNPIKVVYPPKRGQPIVPGGMVSDTDAQVRVNQLMPNRPVIDKAVGYDAIPVQQNDQDAFNRVFSHTFPMSESIRRPDEVAEFHRLADSATDRLILPKRIIHAEDRESLAQLQDFLPEGKADIAIFSAVLFEQPPQVIDKIFENVTDHCNEGALFFITDFIEPNESAPHGFRFIRGDWWHRPGSFATFVMDPFKPGRLAEEIARFSTRRSTEMWLTPKGRQLILGA